MKGNKGWIRIAEAFIAILLITTVMITMYSKQIAKKDKSEIVKMEDAILNEIANNEKLRQEILSNQTQNVTEFISTILPNFLNFDVIVCGIYDICNLDRYIPNVYVRERVISSTLYEYSPKKIKLFMWEK